MWFYSHTIDSCSVKWEQFLPCTCDLNAAINRELKLLPLCFSELDASFSTSLHHVITNNMNSCLNKSFSPLKTSCRAAMVMKNPSIHRSHAIWQEDINTILLHFQWLIFQIQFSHFIHHTNLQICTASSMKNIRKQKEHSLFNASVTYPASPEHFYLCLLPTALIAPWCFSFWGTWDTSNLQCYP